MAFVPWLRSRFDPGELVAGDSQILSDEAWVSEQFGSEPRVAVVLVESERDLLSHVELARMHALAMELAGISRVERVESLTTSRLPLAEVEDPGATLDDLDDDVGSDPVVLDLLHTIVGADPERFPTGLLSLQGGGIQLATVGEPHAELSEEQSRMAREVLARTPLLRRRFVSDDAHVAAIVLVIERTLSDEQEQALLGEMRRVLSHHRFDGSRLSITGLGAMRAEMVRSLREDQWRLVFFAVLGSLIVLMIGMRSAAGVLLPLATVGISLSLTMAIMVLSDTPLNLLTNMLPPLLLTIGLAEAMHMVLRFGELREAGLEPNEAAAETLRTMWLACFVTTFTTAVGFGALIFQETEVLRRFGAISAVATMLTYVVTVLLVPAALPTFRSATKKPAKHEEDALDRALWWSAAKTAAHPFVTIAAALGLFVWFVSVAFHIEVDSRVRDQFARDSDVARTSGILEEHLDGFRSLEVTLASTPGTFHTRDGLALVETIGRSAAERPEMLRVTSAADWAREAHVRIANDEQVRSADFHSDEELRALIALMSHAGAPISRYVTEDGSAARIEMRVLDHGAARTLQMAESLRALAESSAMHPTVRVSGEAYANSHGLNRVVRSLGSLSAAVVVIFIVMTLLFRSLRLGLISVPPNALPLAFTLAYMVWRGIALHAATVIVFTVTVGLAVDGTTHVMARYREELAAGGTSESVLRRTVAGSGRGVLLSSLTLIVGYLVLLASTFEPVRLFGELSGVAIIASTICQTFFLPALLAAFGPRPSVHAKMHGSNAASDREPPHEG
jgi:predicted RND superfamily exporter protein